MSLLYKGLYRKRFESVCKLIKGNSVTELCFGDTIIAEYCKQNNIAWKGLDIHSNFVQRANKKAYTAELWDIRKATSFPQADTLIISGSLYHFNADLESIFQKMLACSSHLIISEPVLNLSDRNGIIGKLAKGKSDVNGEKQPFRFDEESLLKRVQELSSKLNFNFKIADRISKDIIIVIKNKEFGN